jgi:hypothetical protein
MILVIYLILVCQNPDYLKNPAYYRTLNAQSMPIATILRGVVYKPREKIRIEISNVKGRNIIKKPTNSGGFPLL